ncbi:MAG: glycosyltransferase family 39 protein [Chloroflexota bacterium]
MKRIISSQLYLSLLLVVLALATWLRWQYIQNISLYVDEFTTIWAATRVQELGIPLMTSGVLYTRGLLASYVEAGFLSLFGYSYTIARLPNLLFNLGTIIAVFLIGRRLWHIHVGWLAALGLALLPEAIVWGGSARFYAQLQFFTVLMAWMMFESLSVQSRKIHAATWLFTLFFILSLFSQEETILLYPSLLLATVLWRGWRYLLTPTQIVVHGICVVAMGLRYLIEIIGQPQYFETIQSTRPYVGLIFDIQGAWATYAPILIAQERLPWTVLSLVAVGAALVSLAKANWQIKKLSRFHQATLFFTLQFIWVLVVILTLVGTTWREIRYLFFVQPFWLLVGAAGAMWIVGQIFNRGVRRERRGEKREHRGLIIVMLVLSGLIIGGFWRPAQEVVTAQVEGYDHALAFLSDERQENDIVMSPQPPACALVLGPCDYYAVQRGYEEYIIPQGDQLVDRWSGATLMNTVDQLRNVLMEASDGEHTVWFVTDSFRLATRYDEAFVHMVIERFEIAYTEQGLLVLQSDGWVDSPTMVVENTFTSAKAFGPMHLPGLSQTDAQAGKPLTTKLLWRSAEGQTISQQFNTSLQLVAADGPRLVQADGPPARNMIPTNLIFDMPIPDIKTLQLPDTLKRGRYRLELSVYDIATLTPQGPPQPVSWLWFGEPIAEPETQVDTHWANRLRLVGYDPLPDQILPSDMIHLRLVWSTDAPIDEDYTVFVHVVGQDENGNPKLLAQNDRAPEGGFYPTSGWVVGALVEDVYTLILPEEIDGDIEIMVGLYRPDTGERLQLMDGTDVITLEKRAVFK